MVTREKALAPKGYSLGVGVNIFYEVILVNLKNAYIDFFKSKGHTHIPSASIVPENDPTCLFTTAGMHPLVPYLLGERHPAGTRLVNSQKCIRLTDIEEVGDKTHHTFFEMLGNWSLGDYFKKEAIEWSFEFLTKVLNIPIERLGVSVFIGDENASMDEFAASVWRGLGIPEERIAYLGKEDNWWGPAGETGPCGPDTEMFYWSDNNVPAPKNFDPEDKRWVEIWNDVFMEYNKTTEGKYVPLTQKNVDTGMGVERVTALLSGVDDNYATEIFMPIINKIEQVSQKSYSEENNKKAMRIVADHIRAIVIIASDDKTIRPSNTDQGYILRRLIRRLTRYAKMLGIDINSNFEQELAEIVVSQFEKYYPEVERNKQSVIEMLKVEKEKFNKTIENGLKEFEKIVSKIDHHTEKTITGDLAFRLYDTFGFPIELTEELAEEKGLKVDKKGFEEKFKQHQELSRQGSEQKFKGGLADHSEQTARLHTATHLLLAGLRKFLGNDVYQKGSNITTERLRFDFSYPQKLTPEQIKQVEEYVNEVIRKDIPIVCDEMEVNKAKEEGAIGVFGDRYDERVKVYTVGEYSKEICGGPHAGRTGELKSFKIVKEEASSAGVRRIKAIIG